MELERKTPEKRLKNLMKTINIKMMQEKYKVSLIKQAKKYGDNGFNFILKLS